MLPIHDLIGAEKEAMEEATEVMEATVEAHTEAMEAHTEVMVAVDTKAHGVVDEHWLRLKHIDLIFSICQKKSLLLKIIYISVIKIRIKDRFCDKILFQNIEGLHYTAERDPVFWKANIW